MKRTVPRVTLTLLIAAFAGSALINYLVMTLLDVCEAKLQPAKALVPFGFAGAVVVYFWFRGGTIKHALSAMCVAGTAIGATVGRFAPWVVSSPFSLDAAQRNRQDVTKRFYDSALLHCGYRSLFGANARTGVILAEGGYPEGSNVSNHSTQQQVSTPWIPGVAENDASLQRTTHDETLVLTGLGSPIKYRGPLPRTPAASAGLYSLHAVSDKQPQPIH